MRTVFFLIGMKVAVVYNAMVLFTQAMGVHTFDSTAGMLRTIAPGMRLVDAVPSQDPYVMLGARLMGICLNGLAYMLVGVVLLAIWKVLLTPDRVSAESFRDFPKRRLHQAAEDES